MDSEHFHCGSFSNARHCVKWIWAGLVSERYDNFALLFGAPVTSQHLVKRRWWSRWPTMPVFFVFVLYLGRGLWHQICFRVGQDLIHLFGPFSPSQISGQIEKLKSFLLFFFFSDWGVFNSSWFHCWLFFYFNWAITDQMWSLSPQCLQPFSSVLPPTMYVWNPNTDKK